jgi:hypothetical protein
MIGHCGLPIKRGLDNTFIIFWHTIIIYVIALCAEVGLVTVASVVFMGKKAITMNYRRLEGVSALWVAPNI